uniref:Uncharacterized protein n=1 Tax=Meloidogyne javanica TaxID=6303 RepID=A0A915M791_MELJA
LRVCVEDVGPREEFEFERLVVVVGEGEWREEEAFVVVREVERRGEEEELFVVVVREVVRREEEELFVAVVREVVRREEFVVGVVAV